MKQKLDNINENNDIFDYSFESMADFHNYFPNNNCTLVISKQKFMNKLKKNKNPMTIHPTKINKTEISSTPFKKDLK